MQGRSTADFTDIADDFEARVRGIPGLFDPRYPRNPRFTFPTSRC